MWGNGDTEMSSNLPKVTQLECPSTDRTVYLVLYPLLLIPGLCLPTSKKRCYIRGHKQQEYPKDHEALILRPMTPSSIIFFFWICAEKKRLHFYRTFHISQPFWNQDSILSLMAGRVSVRALLFLFFRLGNKSQEMLHTFPKITRLGSGRAVPVI